MNYNPRLIKRNEKGTKSTYGRVLVISGSMNMSGCVYFATMGAYRLGCGIVNIFTDISNVASLKILVPEAVFDFFNSAKHPVIDENEPNYMQRLDYLLAKADSVVIGPGLGVSNDSLRLTEYVLKKFDKNIVVDADAINCIALKYRMAGVLNDNFVVNQDNPLYNIGKDRKIIITPHIGELSRLTGDNTEVIKEKIEDYALNIAKKFGIITVIKDHVTKVSDGEEIYSNQSGNSSLSTAGTGDILSGMIAALVIPDEYTFRAVNTAVYLHGKAGEIAGKDVTEYSCMARDVINNIPKAVSSLKVDDKYYNNCVILEVMNGSK